MTRVSLRMVIIKNGKLLASYRSRTNHYCYIGGRLEYGETIVQGCVREIQEELGSDVNFTFNKILYISDFLPTDKAIHNVELFILGDIDKFTEVEHALDPQHPGTDWATWLDIATLPDNFLPKPLTPILQRDYAANFPNQGIYLGKLS